MRKIFGTDGVRGIANRDLTVETAVRIGRAAAYLMKMKNGEKSTFLIGRDTRLSGDMLESAMASGINSMGVDVLLGGVLPTPAVAYLVRSMNLAGGVVISASHNPYEYNGIKIFSRDGFKLSDETEEKIEKIIISDDLAGALPTGERIGRINILMDAQRRYMDFLERTINTRFDNLLIAVDCAHGAAYQVGPNILAELGAHVVAFNVHPTGTNINHGCGSTHPQLLQEVMKSGRFNIGLAFDGDADRLIAVDETGEVIDGDLMMNIFAWSLAEAGQLPGNHVVATVMSNIGLEKALADNSIQMIRAKVGDRYVLEEMIRHGAVLGGEKSGHIIFLDHNTTGDGILSALMLLNAVKKTGKTLSQLKNMMTVYPQAMENVSVKDKKEIMENKELLAYIREKEEAVKGKFRILVRQSGTEPLVRVMAEGPDSDSTRELVQDISGKIREIESAIPSTVGS